MNNDGSLRARQALARTAGVFYLVIIACGLFAELGVRGALLVPGDAAATAARIADAEGLFRLGLLSDAAMIASDIVVAVLFYALLRPAGATLALLAAGFRGIQAAVLAANLLNPVAALILLDAAGPAAGLGPAARESLALSAMEVHAHGYDLGLIFFGFSCLIVGYLIVKSWILPRIIGGLVIAAGLVYLAGSLTRFLAPSLIEAVAPLYAIALVAELSLGLWLVVRGVRTPTR
ncbi:DUF4386 domain-containing protein [Marinicauda salina]|uniref:DUF4386 domain-containing protein n=1 Tax=Marinicauda salina TaxID=2135793 RepID=A0A2U2BU97_9PROT|nr:DUF4386 domain-containing protein [Marinicauda salina]PWE17606.1 DUF4386 domain-containing protein [Marinicauda salina]